MKGIVKDSQVYESLVLYREPASFREGDLDKFWTPEININFNYDRGKIRKAVEKLVEDGRRYGDETKCEQFDFQSVEVNASGDTALVKTLEITALTGDCCAVQLKPPSIVRRIVPSAPTA